jgi:hypothetical protein
MIQQTCYKLTDIGEYLHLDKYFQFCILVPVKLYLIRSNSLFHLYFYTFRHYNKFLLIV